MRLALVLLDADEIFHHHQNKSSQLQALQVVAESASQFLHFQHQFEQDHLICRELLDNQIQDLFLLIQFYLGLFDNQIKDLFLLIQFCIPNFANL